MDNFGVSKTVIKRTDRKVIRELKKRLKSLERAKGEVGFFARDTYTNPKEDRVGLPVATIAWSNNYGIKVAGDILIPQRPFFDLAVHQMHKTFERDMHRVLKPVLKGEMRFDTLLNNYLKEFQYKIQHQIVYYNDINPNNAKITVKLKGFDDVLIRNGKMFDSVRFRIRRGEVT